MAVTIHLPKVHRPDTKRLAAVGVAVLATAVAFTGIQALTNTDTTTASSTSDGTSEVTAVGAVDTSALATWAQQNGLSGLSPASLGPQAAAATTYTLADELEAIHTVRPTNTGDVTTGANSAAVAATSFTLADELEAIHTVRPTNTGDVTTGANSAAVAATSFTLADELEAIHTVRPTNTGDVTTGANSAAVAATSFTLADELEAIHTVRPTATIAVANTDWSKFSVGAISTDAIAELTALGVVADTPETAAEQSAGYAIFDGFIAANAGSSDVPSAAASADYDPYPPAEQSAEGTTQARSNFGSEIEWIEANGWSTN